MWPGLAHNLKMINRETQNKTYRESVSKTDREIPKNTEQVVEVASSKKVPSQESKNKKRRGENYDSKRARAR